MICQFFHLCSVHFCSWCARLTSMLFIVGYPTNFSLSVSLSDMLYYHHKLTVNFVWDMFHLPILNQIGNFLMGPRFHCHCHCTSSYSSYPMNSICLIPAPYVAWYPYYKCYVWRIKCLIKIKVTFQGTLLCEHVL